MSTANTQYHDDEEEFMYTEVLSNYGDLLVSLDVFVLHKLYCYTSQVKYVFRLEKNVNSLGRIKLTDFLGKQQLELSSCT